MWVTYKVLWKRMIHAAQKHAMPAEKSWFAGALWFCWTVLEYAQRTEYLFRYIFCSVVSILGHRPFIMMVALWPLILMLLILPLIPCVRFAEAKQLPMSHTYHSQQYHTINYKTFFPCTCTCQMVFFFLE